jgi:hypothetical protein
MIVDVLMTEDTLHFNETYHTKYSLALVSYFGTKHETSMYAVVVSVYVIWVANVTGSGLGLWRLKV